MGKQEQFLILNRSQEGTDNKHTVMVKRYKFITFYKNYSFKVILPLGNTALATITAPHGKK